MNEFVGPFRNDCIWTEITLAVQHFSKIQPLPSEISFWMSESRARYIHFNIQTINGMKRLSNV